MPLQFVYMYVDDCVITGGVVSLELIWTSGSVEYPLDEVPTDDIMCELKN